MIKLLDNENTREWDEFVEQSVDATFFHRAGWKNVIEKAFGHATYYLYVEQQGEIKGILPLVYVNSLLFGKSLCSTPFCVYGGIVADDDAIREQLNQKSCDLAKELKVDYLELRNRVRTTPARPVKTLYVTFRKEIAVEDEANMQAIPRKQRAMIRKGIKAGLTSHIEQDVERFFKAYSESVRNLGTPVFSKKYFKILKEVFKDECEILTVLDNQGELVSSVMSFYFKDEVLPYYAGGTALARVEKGNDFMYWELMRRAVARGIKVFDFGRSKEGTGSYSFKKHWGFEPEPLFYEFHLVNADSMPDKNPLNPKYQMFIKAWQRLPLIVSQIIGPCISKDLG